MLEQLFGSKTRVRLLMLLLNNPGKSFYLREISRKIKVQLNSVRREVLYLEKVSIIKSVKIIPEVEAKKPAKNTQRKKKTAQYKKFYLINTESVIYPELKAMFLKAQLLLEKNLINEIEKIAQVQYLALTGVFVGMENFSTDLLLIGKVNKKNLVRVVKKFERALNRPINYTVMPLSEFKYRQDITDRFLYDIIEGKKIVVIDKISK
ncbi:hypothetical protein KKA15_00550 [Patescibacteria group bacterium]|nr:hypothetical protein [Patescibacteria group bacterium]